MLDQQSALPVVRLTCRGTSAWRSTSARAGRRSASSTSTARSSPASCTRSTTTFGARRARPPGRRRSGGTSSPRRHASARRRRRATSRARVAAVAVTGQWASTIPVDAAGRPTGPCITWQDTTGGREVRDARRRPRLGLRGRDVLRWVRRTAGAPSLSGADPIGHILSFCAEHPDAAASDPLVPRARRLPDDAASAARRPRATRRCRARGSPTSVTSIGSPTTSSCSTRSASTSASSPPLRRIGSVVGTVTPRRRRPRSGSRRPRSS